MFRKLMRALIRMYIYIFYKIEYSGIENLPSRGPVIIAANHQSMLDIAVIHCKTKPWVFWVAKKELVDIPLFGRWFISMGVMPVDRKKSDLSVTKMMFSALKENRVIGIFPQGTRTKSEEARNSILPKTGTVAIAIKANVPIVPVGISSSFKLFSRVIVNVGEPIMPETLNSMFTGDDKTMQQAIYLMKHIYNLTDLKYSPDNDFVKEISQ